MAEHEQLIKHLAVPGHLLEAELKRLENRVWVPDPIFCYRLCTLIEDIGRDVIVAYRDQQGFQQRKTVPKCQVYRTSLSHYCEDMCNLTELNEACALHTIHSRYEQRLIHTYSGLFCVVLNPWTRVPLYSRDMMNMYMNVSLSSASLPPHIYAVAQNAYEGIKTGHHSNQAILITGESGAGKTENTKKIIEYLICAADPGRLQNMTSECNSDDVQGVILSAGLALESFSNAKTVHNNNSSRLGKFICLEYDAQGRLQTANIDCYLLEKSRVVSQNEGDRNFHVFYEMFANDRLTELRQRLGITKATSEYRFLNQGGSSALVGMPDKESAAETEAAMQRLGFGLEELDMIDELVAGCVLLGEMKFGERAGMDISYPERMQEIHTAAAVLQVKANKLVDAVCEPSFKVSDRLIRRTQNLKKTLLSVAALAKVIYQRLFEWILNRCNQRIAEKARQITPRKERFIGVLDMAGFEIMSTNSFEQLCINFTNEKLQQFFNHFMFVKEQSEYISEGIEWTQVDYGCDLQQTIDLIERPMGLLSLLQEECIITNSSEQSLLAKLFENLGSDSNFNKIKMSSKSKNNNHFLLTHYTGQVAYNIDGWLEKNRDQVDQSLFDLMSSSTHPLLRQLFVMEEPSVKRRGSLATSTVSFIYKEQLQSLLHTLAKTQAHFIRCIVPNHSRRPFEMNPQLVLHQLKCNGVLEGLRICQRGYPSRISFDKFVERYLPLTPAIDRSVPAVKQVVQMVERLNLDTDKFQIGRTKLFCKTGFLSELEDRRKARISEVIANFQAHIRWYHEQETVEEKEAVLVIQENLRAWTKLTEWPWLKLWKRTKELIPMKREKERLAELEREMDAMKEFCEIMKDEKAELEQENVKLTNTVQELEAKCRAQQSKRAEVESELHNNENLLEMMEKKFDEQHSKVMKLNSTLKDNIGTLERLDQEKRALEAKVLKLREDLAAETTLRVNSEGAFEVVCQRNEDLERRMDLASAEMQHNKERIDEMTEKAMAWQHKCEEAEERATELQKEVIDLNEKLNNAESSLYSERAQRRKQDHETDMLEEQVVRLEEDINKLNVQKDALREQLRVKENAVRKLERELDDKKTEMNDCVTELKKSHKSKTFELHNQIDELKRRCMKLESENKQQKAKLEGQERENSAEPDLSRPGSALSRFGSRVSMNSSMYSTNSINANSSGVGSSIRTLGSREHRYGSLNSSTYSMESSASSRLLQHSSSGQRLSRQATLSNVHQTLADLDRSPSTSSMQQSHLHNAEKKCSQLERELQSIKTDYQLAKRELEVYKQSLQEVELTCETQGRQLKALNKELEGVENKLKDEECRSHELEMQLKKTHRELENSKRKVEETIAESKNDIMAERKRLMDKMAKAQEEHEHKIHLLQSNLKTVDIYQQELIELRVQLDRANNEIVQLNRIQKSTCTMGETWEQQYRMVLGEMESIRDENASLKSKIRRQYKQIEVLTQQQDLDDCVSELEDRIGSAQDKF